MDPAEKNRTEEDRTEHYAIQAADHRRQLAQKMPASSIAILPSGRTLFRNSDAEYPFRQESNFYYLTGFNEPDAVFVLKKEEGNITYILFCRPNHPEEEIWTGKRMGVEGAVALLGADQAYAIGELDKIMPNLLENKQNIVYSLGCNSDWDKRVMEWKSKVSSKTRKGIHTPGVWLDLAPMIHELRLIKSDYEIALMRKACDISVNAHKRLMKCCEPNQKEYELEAEFLYACYQQGCRGVAYSSIVAGGENACTLHYTQNNKTLKAGDLVLVDAGGEYQCYAADITRTFPVNGKFTEDQKKIYQLVLNAQLAAIEQVRPGTRYDQLQEVIVSIMVKGLVELNILKGRVETLIQQKAYQPFYMHSSGHWIGLDVHDVGEYKIEGEWRSLLPGMTLTVEPGLYIAPGQAGVEERWWGIGVRIEDDVLVTETGHEVLTKAPKTIEAIEHFMKPDIKSASSSR